MRILVIGSGAREHALCRMLARDAQVVCANGNAGIAAEFAVRQVVQDDPEAVCELAQDLAVDLVVIGPEAPLVAGVADALREKGFAVFGPNQAAAALEGSKAFAKEVMAAAGVPTATAEVCASHAEVLRALDRFGAPHVVKDDGLAAGKGVVVTSDREAAISHAQACLDSGHRVVIEEFLDGPEVSLFGVSDGTTVIPLQPAQDFKRLEDNDAGPNTGGMGAYSPLPWAPIDLMEEVRKEVLQPMVAEMQRRGIAFAGLLYAGLALTSRGVRVIEFNARFGDPETQVVVTRLTSSLSALLYASATGTLADLPPLHWSTDSAVTVVLAAPGYPANVRVGDSISGLDDLPSGVVAFHAGTRFAEDGAVVTAGGRVISVTATGKDLTAARNAAYSGVQVISFAGVQHRTDIARLAAQGELA